MTYNVLMGTLNATRSLTHGSLVFTCSDCHVCDATQ